MTFSNARNKPLSLHRRTGKKGKLCGEGGKVGRGRRGSAGTLTLALFPGPAARGRQLQEGPPTSPSRPRLRPPRPEHLTLTLDDHTPTLSLQHLHSRPQVRFHLINRKKKERKKMKILSVLRSFTHEHRTVKKRLKFNTF